MKREKGITLIALAVTIVILIILVAISIGALNGDSGIIKQAIRGKEANEIDEEKEILNISSVQAIDRDVYGNITEKYLQDELNHNAGENKTIVYDEEDKFVVEFIDSKRYYNLDKDGNVEGPIDIKRDDAPGELEGNGTEDDPFVIMSIEDLVYFSQSTNQVSAYQDQYIILGKTLDFKSKLSYGDYTTTKYDEYLGGDGTTRLMEQLLEGGLGYKPIGTAISGQYYRFCGTFDGQGYEIKNIYENVTSNGGLFDTIYNATIKNLRLSGTMISNNYAAGIACGANNSYIYQCYSNVNVVVQAGGGICSFGSNSYFINCYNAGKISGKWQTGVAGIVGTCSGENNYIYNCYNLGDIELINGNSYAAAGGIIGYVTAETHIENCYNIGKVTSSRFAGAIAGGYNADNTVVEISLNKCYYLDNMSKEIGCKTSNDATVVTLKQIQNKEEIESEYIINLLNNFVETYNTENEGIENFIKLKTWEIDDNTGYPTFKK